MVIILDCQHLILILPLDLYRQTVTIILDLCDFYKVDPHLFSPAQVAVTVMQSGKTFTAGTMHPELLQKSFTS